MPGYLSAVSGVSYAEMEAGESRWKVLGPALLFCLSFTAMFVALGMTATGLGQTLQEHRALMRQISGIVIIALGAFFIATDPVSAATSDRGKLIYGGGIGVVTYVIRTWGGYPDGVAFAVLLMNFAVPLIDRYTIPRIYGHAR